MLLLLLPAGRTAILSAPRGRSPRHNTLRFTRANLQWWGSRGSITPVDQVRLVCQQAYTTSCKMREILSEEWARLPDERARLQEW
jgi:hypothetical protein